MGKRISIENPNQWLLLFVCLLIFFLFVSFTTHDTHTHTQARMYQQPKSRGVVERMVIVR